MSFNAWRVAEGKRLYQVGAESLSLTELLAYVVRDAHAARSLVEEFPGIRQLGSATYDDLVKVKGVSEARAEQVLAALEIGRRSLSTPAAEKATITCPEDAYTAVRARLAPADREMFVVLLLNSKNGLIRIEPVSVGTVNSSIVHPREVFNGAIKALASAVILAHNHPSGSPKASREDILITRRMVKTGTIVGIDVVDHIIVGDGTFVSMKEAGYL